MVVRRRLTQVLPTFVKLAEIVGVTLAAVCFRSIPFSFLKHRLKFRGVLDISALLGFTFTFSFSLIKIIFFSWGWTSGPGYSCGGRKMDLD